MSNPTSEPESRRAFLGTTAGTGLMLISPQAAFSYQANSTVEIGLIGCGGRGNWITPFFVEHTGARVVALADVVRANLDSTAAKFKVDGSRAYYGPEAYKELSHSKLDAVVIQSPPYFHPEQAREAVDAGKHVYLAKPVAVDVPGCRSILESGKKAAGKLSYFTDFQTRARPAYIEAAQRIHRGDIGKPQFAQVYYYASRPAPDKSKPDWDEGRRRVANFYMDKVVGGDIIVEQNIHVIDVANWFLNSRPVKASGTGGRADWSGTPYDAGNAYDHFAVTFWYPDDVHVTFSSSQLARGFSDLCVRVFGIKGCADTHYGGSLRIGGSTPWVGPEKDDTFTGGTIENVKTFVASIKSGKYLNNAEQAVESNLTAILGRTAAYREQLVTWDDMMSLNEKLQLDVKLRW